MADSELILRLPDHLLAAIREAAAARDTGMNLFILQAIQAEIRRAPRPATSPDRAEERRLAMLRARFAEDVAYARDWHDLQRRLKVKGAILREAGGGLALVAWPSGARICKASDLGASLTTLARRFRAPFPGDRAGDRWHRTVTTDPGETEVIAPDDPLLRPSGDLAARRNLP